MVRKAQQIQNQNYYQNFLNSFKSEQTKRKYIIELNYYLRYLGVNNPNSLISDKLLDSQPMIRQIEDQIIDYINQLKKSKLSYSAINVCLYSILKFYMVNRVNLNRRHIAQYKPQQKKTRKDLAYTHEQIQRLIDSTKNTERDRAMILLMASTGMRIGALCTLTIGNISKVYPEGYPRNNHIYKIIVYEGEREEYYTYTTFESAQALDSYLDYRKRFGEVLTDKSPLFRNHLNSNLPSLSKLINKPKFLSNKSLNSAMDRLLIRSGLRTRTRKKDKHLHDNMLSHGMRKFHSTQMIAANVEYNTRQFLVGHRTAVGLDTSYDRTPEENRLAEYLKAIELLTISPENRLRRKVQEQHHTIEVKLREKDQELEDMKKKYESKIESIREETNQKFNQIIAMIQQNPQLAQIKPEVLSKELNNCV